MRIEKIASIADETLGPLVAHHRYGLYGEDYRLPWSQVQLYEMHRLKSMLGHPEAVAWLARDRQGEPAGMLVGRFSPWDTDHFGCPVAILDALILGEQEDRNGVAVAGALLEAFESWAGQREIKFAFTRLSARQLPVIHALEGHNFRFIESYITNVFEFHRLGDSPHATMPLRCLEKKDMPAMLAATRDAFATQRFHADPHIPYEKAEALYRKWIQSAYEDPSRDILVADVEGRPALFAICKVEDHRPYLAHRSVTLQMIMFAPEARGKGFGRSFMDAVFRYYQKQHVDVMYSGVTMRNTRSVNWHNKLGFRVIATLLTFHRWFS